MFIKKILDYDKESGEGEVLVSDGVFLVNCFVYQTNSVIEHQSVKYIIAFGCSDIVLSDNCICGIEKNEEYFSYKLTAILYSKNEGIVQIGKLRIVVDSQVPGDLQIGDVVTFSVQRLDCVI